MTRLFLAAGVAALAISAPATAKPGGGQGGGGPHGGGGQAQAVPHGGGGGHGGGNGGGGPHFQMSGGGGGHGGGGPHLQSFGGGGGHGGGGPRVQAQGFERHGGGGEHMQMQRFAMPREQHQQMHAQRMQQPHDFERHQMQAQRQQMRANELRQAQNRGFERHQVRTEQAQRNIERQQLRENRMQQVQQQAIAREQLHQNRFQQAQAGIAARDYDRQFRVNEDYARAYYNNNGRGLINGCPPGLWAKNNGCLPPGQARKLLGAPLASVAGYTALGALPANVAYLYPETPDYYYRYGDGYAYQVNRSNNVIAGLIPLLAGGYMPGQYLPQPYMASYVPDYYGFNSFYPDYGNQCNRYANGVIYQVDCYSGMVENVVPVYAGGYGVGQILPSSYAYYNVPQQYRMMYYDTPDYNYWYAPGAIYQYDPQSSMITSVAALLSPGFTVGQALPMGYDVYNVPYDYRATYYDTPNAWYRYNNGYIYQVDPVTRLVTAIVASILA